MAKPRVFAVNLFRRAAGVELNSGDALRDAVGAILVVLVRATPVGGGTASPTDPHPGLARSNWQVSLTGATSLVAETSENEAVSRGLAAAKELRHDGMAVIANAVPYIGKLNRGSSAQAPAGFVQLAAEAGVASVRGVRLLRKR